MKHIEIGLKTNSPATLKMSPDLFKNRTGTHVFIKRNVNLNLILISQSITRRCNKMEHCTNHPEFNYNHCIEKQLLMRHSAFLGIGLLFSR